MNTAVLKFQGVLKASTCLVAAAFLLFVALYLGPVYLKEWGKSELAPYLTCVLGILALYLSSHVKWFANFIPILIDFIPGGSAWLERQKRKKLYVNMAKTLESALDYYGVKFPIKYSARLSKESAQEDDPLRSYAKSLVQESLIISSPADGNRLRRLGKVISILYEERERDGGASIFKEGPEAKKVLAEVLVRSGKLGRSFRKYFAGELAIEGIGLVERLLTSARMFKIQTLVEQIEDELERARKVVDGFQIVIETYGLGSLDEPRKRELTRKLVSTKPEGLPEACAEELARELDVSHQVLKVLYRERKGGISLPHWPRTEEEVLRKLAGLLLGTGRFPQDYFRADDDASVNLLLKLLKQLESFQFEAFLAALNARIAASCGVVDRMAGTVEVYAEATLSAARRIDLTNLLLEEDPTDPVECCARALAVELDISCQVLVVLYHERGGRIFEPVWPKGDEQTLNALANVLVRSGRLPTEHVEPGELARLLAALEGFKLEDLAVELRKVNELRRLVDSYLSFLKSHGLKPEPFRFKTARILDVIQRRGSLPQGSEGFYKLDEPTDVLVEAGELSIASWVQEAVGGVMAKEFFEDEIMSFSLISIILYFTRTLTHQAIRKRVCRVLAAREAQYPIGTIHKPIGILMAWAYLEAKQDFRSGNWASTWEFLRLDEFLPQWRDLVEERGMRPGGFGQELDTLQDHLAKGVWLNNKKDLMWQAFGLGSTVEHAADSADARPHPPPVQPAAVPTVPTTSLGPMVTRPRPPGCKPLLKKLFLRLELETIERFLETHAMTPYVLTVRAGTGPVQTLLDCLPAKEGRVRHALKEAGIEILVDPADARGGRVADSLKYKYNFKLYTRQSRIGVLPKGMTFKEFCSRFRDDFQKAVDHRSELLTAKKAEAGAKKKAGAVTEEPPEPPEIRDYEILVHAFNPTGHNPFDFGEPGGRRLALQRLKGLFAELLSEDDLENVLLYSEAFDYDEERRVDLLEVLFANPIPGISSGNGRLAAEEQAILADEDGKIWESLLQELKTPAAMSVDAVFREKKLWKRAGRILAKVIARRVAALSGTAKPGSDPAKVYLESVLAPKVRKDLAKNLGVAVWGLARSLQSDEPHAAEVLATLMTRHISSLSRRDAEDLAGAITRHVSTLSAPAKRAERLARMYLERKRDQRVKEHFLDTLGIGNNVQELTRALQKPQDVDAALAASIRRYVPDLPGEPLKLAQSYRREVEGMTKALRQLELTIGHAELVSAGP